MLLKELIKRSLLSSMGAPIRNLYSGKGTVLLYHRITQERFSKDSFQPEAGLAVHVDEFEEQIAYVSQHFNCVSALEASNAIASRSLHEWPMLVVTFDDGFADNLHLALPILEKYNVPASIFVSTAYIDRQRDPWWLLTGAMVADRDSVAFEWDGTEYQLSSVTTTEKNEAFLKLDALMKSLDVAQQDALLAQLSCTRYAEQLPNDLFLTWDEVLQLHKHPLITIGAHTVNHAALASCSEETVRNELLVSKETLERHLGATVLLNAYPYGSKNECDTREFALAAEAGFQASFTTRPGHLQAGHALYPQSLPRIAIDHFNTMEEVRTLLLSGLAAMLKRKGEILTTS